jgi:endo-1,4-beta-xylanase
VGGRSRPRIRWALLLLDILLVLGNIILVPNRYPGLFPFLNTNAALPGTLAFYAARLNFNIGTHIAEIYRQGNTQSQRAIDLIRSEYKGMTVNFALDWRILEPEPGKLAFQGINLYVKFAQANDLTLNYAHLLWPTYPLSYPDWLFPDRFGGSCGTRTRDDLARIVSDHIQVVIGHAAPSNRVVSWNVVNEPFDERGELRQDNCFYQILGAGYLDDAFRAARVVSPDGILILNEFFQTDASPSGINLDKIDGVFAYVAAAKARGVPIDVVGIQNHLVSATGNYFSPFYLVALHHIFEKARAAGVRVMITEMDVYQGSRTQDDVGQVYRETLAACLADANCIWFSTWGVSDAFTWLRRFSTLADPDPLLFDANYQPKPAFHDLIEAFQESVRRSGDGN